VFSYGALSKLFRYIFTAGAAAIVDLGGFALFQRAGSSIGWAASISFGVAAFVNYFLTSRYVFQQRRSIVGFASFVAGALVGFGVNVGVTVLLATVFGLWPLFAKLVGITIAFFVNFLINSAIVFRLRSGH
jgi:putative flippase GtrA